MDESATVGRVKPATAELAVIADSMLESCEVRLLRTAVGTLTLAPTPALAVAVAEIAAILLIPEAMLPIFEVALAAGATADVLIPEMMLLSCEATLEIAAVGAV